MSLSTARDRALEFADRLHGLGPFSVDRFFGGAALARNGASFAFVIEGTLYLRVDDQSRPAFEARGASPFTYGTRARTVTVASYYALPEEIEDDADQLRDWAIDAIRAATLVKQNRRRPRRPASPP
jgi:DNA transformation protein and related proteins